MKNLLTHTESLMNHVYWFRQDFNIQPRKKHIGTTINYTDIFDREEDFLRELVNTISGWVYSKTKAKQIVDERILQTNGDPQNAYSFLTTQAFSKFRPGHPQGQFGELLLFNFIQFFFKAVPLLRKQPIATSVGHERFGADAIHYRENGDEHHIILGESKCYKSKYKFNNAFKESLNSIVKTVMEFNNEMNLYTYDDFLEPELEDIAKQYKRNTLKNIRFEFVCLIAYNEDRDFKGNDEEEMKQSIRDVIQNRCASFDVNHFKSINQNILNRINYIIFPIKKLDSLLDKFQKQIGI